MQVTDEQLIDIVNKYMEEHPTAGRNHVILHAFGNHTRVRELDKKGLITLPKPMPKGSKSNWAKYFNKGGCKGGIGSRDSGNANSTQRKNASNSLGGSSGAGGSSSPALLASTATAALSSAAGLGGSASDQTPPGTPPATLTPEQMKAKGFVTTAEAGLATRNGKQFKSPISAELAKRVKAFQNSLPPGTEQVITDTNDTGIHKSIAQNTGKSVDVNFKNFNPSPDRIATVIAEGKKNGLKLEYEVATKEEAEAIYKSQPSLRGSGQVKVVKHITAPHFSVYMA